jgi:hypothetical protein
MKLIVVVMAIGLASCSSSKVVYQRDKEGKEWKSASNKSDVTGFVYNK